MTLSLKDLEEFDPELFKGLTNLLNYSGNVEDDIGMMYEYEGHSLIPNGENIPITENNRKEYVDDVVDWIFNRSISSQYSSFYHGLMQSAGTLSLEFFRPDELSLLLTGKEELDFYSLEKNTRYEGFDSQSSTVQNFWEIVHHRFSEQEKRNLLYFFTASPRSPIGGLGTLPFVIAKDGDASHIPSSHTCFYMLVLPEDTDIESLHRKLLIAIENSEGFAFK